MKYIALAVIMLIYPFQGGPMISESHAVPIHSLQAELPKKVGRWKAEPEDRIFDEETIFDYIDGAGEVYRAYNMKNCLSRRYTVENGPAIVLDIFDMGSSGDAFGVFTHDQDGEEIAIGQGALYRPGWLSFWKDRYFVSVYSEEETAEAQRAVKEIGREVASRIKTDGPKPAVISMLPQVGLEKKSVRYLHHPVILNYHYYLADENILSLDPETEAVLSAYSRGGKRAKVLLILYPDRERSRAGFDGFVKHYLPEKESESPVRLENGKWCAIIRKNQRLVIVLEAEDRELAERLLQEF